MPRYTTATDVISYGIGSAAETTLIEKLIDNAEALLDNLLGSKTGLISSNKTEYFPYNQNQPYEKRGKVFFLKTIYPTAIVSIDGVSPGTAGVDYLLEAQRLELKNPVTMPNVFPFKTVIVYTSGYSALDANPQTYPIPKDIKLAVIYMVGALYNRRKTEGIASFKQDLLSINYEKGSGILDTILDPENANFVQAVIAQYKQYNVYS